MVPLFVILNSSSRYFASVYTTVSNDKLISSSENVLHDDHFNKISVGESQMSETLLDIDLHKGAGSDNIPGIYIKNCAASLRLAVTLIYNKSLSEVRFPLVWKHALIVPIFYKCNKRMVEIYRPISKCNIFEKKLGKVGGVRET